MFMEEKLGVSSNISKCAYQSLLLFKRWRCYKLQVLTLREAQGGVLIFVISSISLLDAVYVRNKLLEHASDKETNFVKTNAFSSGIATILAEFVSW